MKRHWNRSPTHTAVRPYPPHIAATRRVSALSADVDELDREPAGIMGDDEGGFGDSEPALDPVEGGGGDNDGDGEDTEDPSIEQTFGEGAGISSVLNDLN